jgi:uncharacterized cupredoxin-like copper-binding protein
MLCDKGLPGPRLGPCRHGGRIKSRRGVPTPAGQPERIRCEGVTVPNTQTLLFLLASAAVLAACQTPPTHTHAAAPAAVPADAGFVTDGAAIVKAADWAKMQTVTVTMEEHSYAPQVMRLVAGQPYKIELKNVGDKDHYYTAPEFFRSVAWRKLMVNRNAEIKVDYVVATEVLKKTGQLDLYLVPVKKGTFPVYCTLDDHRDKGMDAQIIVE